VGLVEEVSTLFVGLLETLPWPSLRCVFFVCVLSIRSGLCVRVLCIHQVCPVFCVVCVYQRRQAAFSPYDALIPVFCVLSVVCVRREVCPAYTTIGVVCVCIGADAHTQHSEHRTQGSGRTRRTE
jgi:hypothetical protein